MVECWPIMYKALGSIPEGLKNRKNKEHVYAYHSGIMAHILAQKSGI